MNIRRYSILAAGLLLSVSVGAVSARSADVAASAIDPWSGFYLGAQAGYLMGTGSDTELCFEQAGFGGDCFGEGSDDINMDGATVGGYLGYNHRMDSFLLGLEGDVNWDNAEGNGGAPAFTFGARGGDKYDMSLNWDASIRARLGVVASERALLYVTGGASWINAELDTSRCAAVLFDLNPGVNCGDTSTEFGLQLGAGGEYMITDRVSMKAEYLHGWYGDAELDLRSGNGFTDYVKQNLQTNVVRAGIAYHFGGL